MRAREGSEYGSETTPVSLSRESLGTREGDLFYTASRERSTACSGSTNREVVDWVRPGTELVDFRRESLRARPRRAAGRPGPRENLRDVELNARAKLGLVTPRRRLFNVSCSELHKLLQL